MYKIIPIDIYNFNLFFIVGDTKELKNSLDSHFEEKAEAVYNLMTKGMTETLTGSTALIDNGQVILWLPDASRKGTVAHEIFHAVCFIMEKVGIGFSNESDEAYAYLIGYLTDKVNEILSISFEQKDNYQRKI